MAIEIKINDAPIAHMPNEFKVSIKDLDYNNSGAFGRAINGELNRNRIAVKRTLELKYNAMDWVKASALLQQLTGEFFTVYYPDVQTGTYETKEFYVSDRPAGVIKTPLNAGDNIVWGAMTFKLIEK